MLHHPGTLYASALTVAGLDLGLIVGMAAGLLSFIPYVRSITGGVTSLGLAMAQFPHWRGVAVVGGVLVIGQILEGYVNTRDSWGIGWSCRRSG